MIDRIPGVDYRFRDPGLLERALTHRSAGQGNYERLEFLGDSVLDLVVAEHLIQLHPKAPEGDLSRMRSRLVRGESLKEIAARLDLGQFVRLGSGERKSGGRRRASILGDALEALMGAVYLDGGFEACRKVILDLIQPAVESLPDIEELKDAKTRLQEFLQGLGRGLPRYELVGESGADHDKEFTLRCTVDDSELAATASGSSRRKAEQAAAEALLRLLQDG
jgi:ribonuclease-3